jgi:glutaminase
MPNNLISVFVPEKFSINNKECQVSDTYTDSIVFKCENYKIFVKLADIGSRHWFDVKVNIAELNTNDAKEAIAIATKLALEIEKNIRQTLFKYDRSFLDILSKIDLSIAAALFAFPVINIKPRRRSSQRVERAQKEAVNTISMKVGMFVNLVITTKRGRIY